MLKKTVAMIFESLLWIVLLTVLLIAGNYLPPLFGMMVNWELIVPAEEVDQDNG